MKVARTGIDRNPGFMYYVKNGDVWATPRKQPGKPKGKPQKVASAGIDMDYSTYIYYVDGDGDIAAKERASGGRKRSGGKSKRASKSKPSSKSAAAADDGDDECMECIANLEARGYTVSPPR